jgi:glucokinase
MVLHFAPAGARWCTLALGTDLADDRDRMERLVVPGRQEPALRSRGERRVVIGADVGATTTAAGLVTQAGEVLSVVRVATHGRGPGTAVQALLGAIEQLVEQARREDMTLEAIGIGLAGLVDTGRGMMVGSKNFVPEFTDLPLADRLRDAIGVPAFVDNDANALALGEWTFGVGRGSPSMALLAVGTGVGGAIIVGGKLVRGHGGCAGEFGFITVDFHGAPYRVSTPGSLNAYASGEALAHSVREAVPRGEASKVLALAGGDPEQVSAAHVFRAAAMGDAFASALVERACKALGAVIGTIINTLDPGLVVVTGGVSNSLVHLENRLHEFTARYAEPRALAHTRVRLVTSDKSRTVLGGAALAFYEMRESQLATVGRSRVERKD